MSKKTNENIRFNAEDYFKGKLTGERLVNAQNLFDYLTANDFIPGEGWIYKGKDLFAVHAYGDDDNNWFIYWDMSNFEKFPIEEDMKEFIWANIRICSGQCGCPNWPRGGNQTVFGKEFKSVCSSTIWFQSPDAETLKNIKKLVMLAKHNIDNMQRP